MEILLIGTIALGIAAKYVEVKLIRSVENKNKIQELKSAYN